MNKVEVKICRLPHGEGLPLPEYQTEYAAGMDLPAAIGEEGQILKAGTYALVPTGLSIALPPGYEAQIRPRSGLAARHGLGLVNSPGTIDGDYRGEIKIILMNWGQEDFHIRRGMRIAQMVIAPVCQGAFKLVTSLEESARGEGGFGHSGL